MLQAILSKAPEGIRRFFSPSLEISKEDYYRNFISAKDGTELKSFVNHLSTVMKEHYFIPVSILAVGSSTFSRDYWKRQKDISEKNPKLNVSTSYRDIDLLILPEEVTSLEKLGQSIKRYLNNTGFEFQAYDSSRCGVIYCNGSSIDSEGNVEDGLLPFVQMSYGTRSITTSLPNGTSLDLILGRETELDKTAKEKIAEERKSKRPFSLLGSSKDVSD